MRISSRRLILSAFLALALTACGGALEDQGMPPQPEVAPQPESLSQTKQGITYISGYSVYIDPGVYTVAGLIMPRWQVPLNSGSPENDYVTFARVGSPVSEFLSYQYIGLNQLYGAADQITIPTTTDTNILYEVRYFRSDGALAAVSEAFSVKAAPRIACGTTITNGNRVPTAHIVDLYKTSGYVAISWNMFNDQFDGVRIIQGTGTLLYDSGQRSGPGASSPVYFQNALGRVLVRTVPDLRWSGGFGDTMSWTLPCP